MNKQKIHLSTYGNALIKSIGCVFLVTSILCGGVFAANDPEIDVSQLFQDIILRDKDAGDRSTLADTIVDGRDLFDASFAYESYNQAQNASETLDLVYDHLTTYNEYCPGGVLHTRSDPERNAVKQVYLHPDPRTKKPEQIQVTKKDIMNIYTLADPGMQMLGNLNTQRLFSFEEVSETDDAFLESCKWIVGCHQGMQKINFDGSIIKDEEIPATTTQERALCELIVTDLFDLYSTQIDASLNYDENRDWEIYYNNILEEDRGQVCDVNVELENIAKILGSNAQDFQKYSFFDPQTVPKNSDSSGSSSPKNDVRLPTEYVSDEEEIPTDSSFTNSIEDIPYNSVPDESLTRDVSADYLGASENGKKVVGPSGAGGGNTDRLLAKPKEGGLSSLITTPKKANDDLIGGAGTIINPQCEVSELGVEDKQIDLFDESSKLTKTLQEYSADLDKDERLAQALANEKLLTKKEQESHHKKDEPLIPAGDLVADLRNYIDNQARVDEPDTESKLKQMEDDIKACITQHTDEDPESWRSQLVRALSASADIRECISKVMCKEIVDPSGIGLYRVRFCSRLEKPVSTPNTKKVTSIFDSMQTIYAVLEGMTTSGRMIKHKQATESLESQIPDIKFKDMFSFTIDVVQNTPRTTSDPKVQKKIADQEHEEIKKITMNEYEDLSVKYPFVESAILYSEARVNAIEQDLQISTDFQGSLQQANDIINELNRSSEDLHDYYRRLATFEQINHGAQVMKDNIDFWRDMLALTEEMRSELDRHYNQMKGR